jgi:hypothetical protein
MMADHQEADHFLLPERHRIKTEALIGSPTVGLPYQMARNRNQP